MRRTQTNDHADTTALLGAFCFFLSAVEYMIPKPLPFMRLGIANLPILLAVDILPARWFFALALVKVVGMSLVSGSLFSYIALFSLSGTMTAAAAMWAARRAGGRHISAIGVSIAGAMASNAVQTLLAMAVVFGQAAKLIAPVFLGTGLVTGALLGVFVERFARDSAWFRRAAGLGSAAESAAADAGGAGAVPGAGAAGAPAEPVMPDRASRRSTSKTRDARGRRRERWERAFDPRQLAVAGMVVSVAFLFQKSLALQAAMFAVFLAAALLSGKRVSVPATLFVSAGIIAANLLVPVGRVLYRLGPLTVTETALYEGVGKALVFEGLVCLSKASILPTLRLPGRFGAIIASAFVYYDRIVEYKGGVRAASFIADIDALMLRVWDRPADAPSAVSAAVPARGLAGGIVLALVAASAVGLLFVR